MEVKTMTKLITWLTGILTLALAVKVENEERARLEEVADTWED
jgi:hypothetical protein